MVPPPRPPPHVLPGPVVRPGQSPAPSGRGGRCNGLPPPLAHQFPTRLLLFLSTVSAVFCGHLVKAELSRFLVRADGLLPNPFLPGVHLEDRMEPHSRAGTSAGPPGGGEYRSVHPGERSTGWGPPARPHLTREPDHAADQGGPCHDVLMGTQLIV
ncbi:unnamed protein product [Rangifer tarandus platyrhynchus]|uniref:Uncharacterized protein n=1 Tax=Rangifer tarandus platyrhynchus TaxID=3082113 RepID=A0AC59YYS6_RANTA